MICGFSLLSVDENASFLYCSLPSFAFDCDAHDRQMKEFNELILNKCKQWADEKSE